MADKTVTVELWGAHVTISRQAPQHRLVLVEIATDMNGMLTATPGQARRLAAALTQMADRIEGPETFQEQCNRAMSERNRTATYRDAMPLLSDTGQHHD